jgi:hypothetical protein
MKVFFVLYVLAGGGMLQNSWGGPTMLRFDSESECRAAREVMMGLKRDLDILGAHCLRVEVKG